jgi:hypothetical protein
VQRAAAQYNFSQRSYIDKPGVGLIPPLLHEIDAVVKLQRLDVPVLMQRHAPRDGSRALPCKHAHTRVRACASGLVRSGQTE